MNWILNPLLYAMAQDKAAAEVPKYTVDYWRKVLQIYQRLGGKLEETSEDADLVPTGAED